MTADGPQTKSELTSRPLESKLLTSHSIKSTVNYSGLSHPGKVRKNNEDQFLIIRRSRSQEVMEASLDLASLRFSREDCYLLMIADGIGGRRFGEIASELALRSVWDVAEKTSSWLMKIEDFYDRADEIQERVATVTKHIQAAFQEMSSSRPEMTGMGTTITAAYVMGPDVIIVNVGDSRVYLFRQDELSQISHDHTKAQHLLDEGVRPDKVLTGYNVLTRAFSARSPNASADIFHIHLQDDDVLLLCSDGLSDMVSDEVIANQLRESAAPHLACTALVKQALKEGGKDNITVIVAQIELQP